MESGKTTDLYEINLRGIWEGDFFTGIRTTEGVSTYHVKEHINSFLDLKKILKQNGNIRGVFEEDKNTAKKAREICTQFTEVIDDTFF